MAVLESLKYFPNNYEKLGMYNKYYRLSQTGKKDFAGLASMIRGLTGGTLIQSFK